jgi:hypothetical protein
MPEVKYNTSHHAGGTPEARVASRLRNSGGEEADHIIHKGGDAPNHVFTNVHNPGSARRHGEPNKGEGSIDNKPRGVV